MKFTHYAHPFAPSLSPAFTRAFSEDFESQIEQLLGTMFARESGLPNSAAFPVDLYADKDNTYVRAELPGAARKDISVELADDILEITATRKKIAGDDSEVITLKRSVRIPENTQGDKISATCENGVLTVTLPKQEQAKPRKFTISVN